MKLKKLIEQQLSSVLISHRDHLLREKVRVIPEELDHDVARGA